MMVQTGEINGMKVYKYVPDEVEKKAIEEFNKDEQFKITE